MGQGTGEGQVCKVPETPRFRHRCAATVGFRGIYLGFWHLRAARTTGFLELWGFFIEVFIWGFLWVFIWGHILGSPGLHENQDLGFFRDI